MQLLTMEIIFSVVFIANNIQAALIPDAENVCLQTETYEETIEVEALKKVTEKKKKMCWSISKFFRCEKLVTKLELVKEPQVVQRTKIVPKCCDGYAEEKGKVNKCSPVCLNGCRNGKCVAPGVCDCSSGFYGSQCEKACPKNFWGNNCANKCDCSNGNCDNISGGCHCYPGWRGESCELPCQDGFYGFYCKEKCNCDNHLCNHKTGECTTLENAITFTMSSTVNESTAEITTKIHQSTESSITTNEKTTLIEELLSEVTERTAEETASSEITSDGSDVTVTLASASVTVEMTEKPNKNEKKLKTINLGQIPFSPDGEVVTKISKEEISVFETVSYYNSTENISMRTTLSEVEKNFDTNGTNNFISERKSSSNTRIPTLFHFPLSLSVISSASLLVFIIAAKWIIFKHRTKAGKRTVVTGKKEKLFQLEEQIKFQTENFFWVNDCIKYPLPDVELNTVPILETFKPITQNKGFISKEKEIK